MEIIQSLTDKVCKLIASVEEKNNQIDIRRKILQSQADSDTNIKKTTEKIEKVKSKYNGLSDKENSSIKYYNDEIMNSQIRMNKEIESIRDKMEIQIKKLQSKHEEYDRYCTIQIEKVEKYIDRNKNTLEKQHNNLNNVISSLIDEDNDRIITKYKEELKLLNKELDEYRITKAKEEDKYNKYVEKQKKEQQREILQQLRLEEYKIDEQNRIKREEIEERKLREKKEEENRYKTRLEEKKKVFVQTESNKLIIKEFKLKHKSLLKDPKYQIELEDGTIDNVYDNILKKDLEYLMHNDNTMIINEWLDNNYIFYKEKVLFDDNITNVLNDLEERIYFALDKLIKEECGYRKFFNIKDINKKKKYLSKLENQYKVEFKSSDD